MINKKVYIEAGANNGITQSRTLHLKDNPEYMGILVEPHLEAYERCVQSRSSSDTIVINSALVPLDYSHEFINLYGRAGHGASNSGSLMATVEDSPWKETDPTRFTDVPIAKVRAITLEKLLDNLKVEEVDYFFLDVEGYEREVLRGVTSRIRINNLEVEQHDLNNLEKEKEELIIICSTLNLELVSTQTTDGHPKLNFKRSI